MYTWRKLFLKNCRNFNVLTTRTVMDVIVGVDVGGTNTDAVVLSTHGQVISKSKVFTSGFNLTGSVCQAITNALNNTSDDVFVQGVHIGTTHFINAVVQRRDLVKVAVIRLCGQATSALPPFSNFPLDLKKVIVDDKASIHLVKGGYEYDGKTVIDEVSKDEIESCLMTIQSRAIKNIVVSGVFSPVKSDQEIKVESIIKDKYPEASVTLSHHIGQLGLLERENAAILNESLKPLCNKTITAFRDALDKLDLTCPFYLTQNDGTLITADKARELPVHTFASGQTNSMRGAAYLSGLTDALVVDIGGTTSDLGVLISGFPRQSSLHVKVGEVQTNFRMPDLVSIGLGGGSLVNRQESGKVKIGPQSVGYRISKEAHIFGGSILTTSDIAVAAGFSEFGTKKINKSDLPADIVEDAIQEIHDMLEDVIDRVKVNKQLLPVILVGGGSVIVPVSTVFKGVSKIIQPQNFDVANAIGAALSQVSGCADMVCSLENQSREEVIENVKQRAISEAVKAQADPAKTQIVDISEVPLAYLPGKVSRIRATAVGDLLTTQGKVNNKSIKWKKKELHENLIGEDEEVISQKLDTGSKLTYQDPLINEKGEWILSHYDIEAIAIGAGILGTGGGGSPAIGALACHIALDEGKLIKVVSPERMVSQMKDNDRVVSIGNMGAPTIIIERLPSKGEMKVCYDAFTRLISTGEYNINTGELETNEESNKKQQVSGSIYFDQYKPGNNNKFEPMNIAAVTVAEIGGSNAMAPLEFAADYGMVTVDCDGMGRAFPELQMTVPTIYGVKPYPAAIADYKENYSVVTYADSPKSVEDVFRLKCIEMGCAAPIVLDCLNKEELGNKVVKYSLSRAWRLGKSVLDARQHKTTTLDAIIKHENATLLCTGKVADIERITTGGFARGILTIEGFDRFYGEQLIIHFQNEFLVAKRKLEDGKEKVLCSTPDLISMVETESGESVPTEEVRYGLRVSVLGIPCTPMLSTETALKVVGPQAFGYAKSEVEFKSIGDYVEHPPIPIL